MNLLLLHWYHLRARPLNAALSTLLLTFGVAIIIVLISLNAQVKSRLTDSARGVDLVIGAKGSPLQLILSSVFHVDFPTGNVSLAAARRAVRSRYVRQAIPLALGDSYRGYRIVGTNHDYPELYEATVARGRLWEQTYETTLGARAARQLALAVGDTFSGQHGLAEAGATHEEASYRVVGILAATGTVLDNLILTSVESIWDVHAHAATAEFPERPDTTSVAASSAPNVPPVGTPRAGSPRAGSPRAGSPRAGSPRAGMPRAGMPRAGMPPVLDLPPGHDDQEITALLVRYRSPMAAVMMPRQVNRQTALQAASPAFEMLRLFDLLGVGVGLIRGFAYLIILISGLSIFVALYNTLKEQRYDLAIMRSLGSSRRKLFVYVLLGGFIITLVGSVLGVLVGHGAIGLLGILYPTSGAVGISGLAFFPEEIYVLLGCLGLGFIAALVPAVNAYRIDISRLLAEGK